MGKPLRHEEIEKVEKMLRCKDPQKNLKLKTGMLAGLQTFGGDMKAHIHEHCIIVDGGIDEYNQNLNIGGEMQ